jgi:hypothetical protein
MNEACTDMSSSLMSDMEKINGSTSRVIDLDIHGYVRIRLINPSESDAHTVKKQLGHWAMAL